MVAAFVYAAQRQGSRLALPYLYCGLQAGKSAAHDQYSPNLPSHALHMINIATFWRLRLPKRHPPNRDGSLGTTEARKRVGFPGPKRRRVKHLDFDLLLVRDQGAAGSNPASPTMSFGHAFSATCKHTCPALLNCHAQEVLMFHFCSTARIDRVWQQQPQWQGLVHG